MGRMLISLAVIFAVVGAVWLLRDILLVAFAAILIAVILDGLAEIVHKALPVPRQIAVLIVLVVIGLVLGVAGLLLGLQVADDLVYLYRQLPASMASLERMLGIDDLPEAARERLMQFPEEGGLLGQLAGYTSMIFGGVASMLLVVVAGIYLAVTPKLYTNGVCRMFPKHRSGVVRSALKHSGHALKLWLLGQLIAMLIVGVATTAGLFMVGAPSALGLGVLAGVLEFIPIVGPLLAAIPAIMIGLSEGPWMAAWIILVYVVVQQVENNLLVPLIQSRTVSLPPVMGLFALLAFGLFFGPLGVVLGTPLTVVLYVLVNQLYVRDTLGWRILLPGERENGDPEDPAEPAERDAEGAR